MTDSPRIPYLLWPVAIVLAFLVACAVNVIERNWKRPPKARPADWRAKLG